MLLKNHWAKEEIKKEIKNMLTQTKWDPSMPKCMGTAKAILNWKVIALNTYIKKRLKNLMLHLKGRDKQPKISRRKEVRITTEINEMQTRKTIEKISET